MNEVAHENLIFAEVETNFVTLTILFHVRVALQITKPVSRILHLLSSKRIIRPKFILGPHQFRGDSFLIKELKSR
jgi:hypothetical protein